MLSGAGSESFSIRPPEATGTPAASPCCRRITPTPFLPQEGWASPRRYGPLKDWTKTLITDLAQTVADTLIAFLEENENPSTEDSEDNEDLLPVPLDNDE